MKLNADKCHLLVVYINGENAQNDNMENSKLHDFRIIGS